MSRAALSFSPQRYESELLALFGELLQLDRIDPASYERILRRHPKDGTGLFSKSDLIRGFRYLNRKHAWRRDEREVLDELRMKPVRTLSGVAPLTVLTKPFPCPGSCIFCPSDVRMPKSYLSSEPGAQRAAQHQFDPYAQTASRLVALHRIGHSVDKIELIILGGTWSFYPESYQIWFIKRCLDALNDFVPEVSRARSGANASRPIDFRQIGERVDGRCRDYTYNEAVSDFLRRHGSLEAGGEKAAWQDLERVQARNEQARARCVGLVVETRPDHLSPAETLRLRRLGATKVQIGIQSLSDEVLRLNRRGHDVAATRQAIRWLREAGFKIHAHWMPNLYGSTPERDREDFDRLFADRDFRPDELKIYPCSLIETAELMAYYAAGKWQPYSEEELLHVVSECLERTPEYCRVTRVVRDIPGPEIVTGSRVTNLRQVAGHGLARRGARSRDIRSREIGADRVDPSDLRLRATEYATSIGRECFLQFVTADDRIAAFLRLSLPRTPVAVPEIRHSAMIREVHVYGPMEALGQRADVRPQHRGLGRKLIEEAARLAQQSGYRELAVISSIGTRPYYRRHGFLDRALYQSRPVRSAGQLQATRRPTR